MQVRFLSGPAGSGKTFRCLAEIRAALAAGEAGHRADNGNRAGGPSAPLEPLILLAPKQATFQLERQLLAGKTIAGFSSLHVLSFDRLAGFIFDRLNAAPPKMVSEEGRLMVLRALLRRHHGELKLLRDSARRPGFAQELAGQLAELRQHQLGPGRLRALAADATLRPELRDKLQDLALLSQKYADWLRERELQDADTLLEAATTRLGRATPAIDHQEPAPKSPGPRGEQPSHAKPQGSSLWVQHLWMDGFAEMTPQELALLAAIIPFCREATLAFCLEPEPTPASSWLSIWSAIGTTFQRCRERLAALPGCEVRTEILQRTSGLSRFLEDSALAILEAGWALPVAAPEFEIPGLKSQISMTACATPEAEAVFAARELLKFVREDPSHRYRDCAVIVRSLDHYHQPLASIFRRYEIPFFIDRRENVAHHPLAELTRNALRTVAGEWRHDDWFAALKAGLTPLPERELDELENLALEFGWRGKRWLQPLPDEYAERLRQRIIAPYEQFHLRLQAQNFGPTGAQLAAAIRNLWEDLQVEKTLEKWSLPETGASIESMLQPALHQTVYEQMVGWAENVAMAFPLDPMPLRDWAPVLDAGLAGLTVGVVPPALDEVLVGAIDRARNPDLKFALVLGVNESVFPAPPSAPVILNNSDREELDRQNASLGPNVFQRISRERYLGYIACTRARQKLALTFCRQDAAGRALNPSPFISNLRRMFPPLDVAEFSGGVEWHQAQHPVELAAHLKGDHASEPNETALSTRLLEIPALKALAGRLAQMREPVETENLPPALAEKIYGAVLKSSVSRLEEFAGCPFRFFVHSGLRAKERKQFELGARERGILQHEILKEFHDGLVAEGKRWRDLTSDAARDLIAETAARLARRPREELLLEDGRSEFTARALTADLQEYAATLVEWMRGQYEFDPALAETGFGLMDEPGPPAWQIDLGDGHGLALGGRVDRIDLCKDGDRSLAVVMDYKSSALKLDKVLMAHGVQMQLLAYMAAVRRWPPEFLGAGSIVPAGVFYVNLRGHFESGSSRTESLADPEAARRQAYRHHGRFDTTWLVRLDRAQAREQFNYRLNKDGRVRSNSSEAISGEEFTGLLDQVEDQLRSLGRRIFSGEASVDPYRKSGLTPCEFCDYRAVCRINDWTHEFRELRAVERQSGQKEGDA